MPRQASGAAGVLGQAAAQPVGLRAEVAAQALQRRALGWAVNRRLAANSVTGISLLLALCAAGWFTAGTAAGNLLGALLLCGAYLAGRGARRLSRLSGPSVSQTAAAEPAVTPSPGMLARVCGAAAEYAVYAGLAVGGEAAGWTGMWALAATVVILLALRQTLTECHGPATADPEYSGTAGHLAWGLLTLSAGWRVLLVAVAAPLWGPLAALFGLLFWALIAVSCAVGGYRPDAAADAVTTADQPPAGRAIAADRDSAGQTVKSAGQTVKSEGTHPGGTDSRLAATIIACRDDGAFARWIGRIFQGDIVALPPAVAGLAAAAILAVLGLRDLPGMILLTPLVVMLLAAPGSSHPHNGRFDWLVPFLLQAGQYIYLGALGFASGVAPPVIFALCAVTAIWYVDLAYRSTARQVAAASIGSARAGRSAHRIDIGLGWEGRMLVAGLGTIVGAPTLAYLVLTAYLAVLICADVIASSPATEADHP